MKTKVTPNQRKQLSPFGLATEPSVNVLAGAVISLLLMGAPDPEPLDPFEFECHPVEISENDILAKILLGEALAQMRPIQRWVVYGYANGYSRKEIACQLRCDYWTVKRNYERALVIIRHHCLDVDGDAKA